MAAYTHTHTHSQGGSVTLPSYSKLPVSSLSSSLHQRLWCASVLGQKSLSAKSLSMGSAAPIRAILPAVVQLEKLWLNGWVGECRGKLTGFSAWEERTFTIRCKCVLEHLCQQSCVDMGAEDGLPLCFKQSGVAQLLIHAISQHINTTDTWSDATDHVFSTGF